MATHFDACNRKWQKVAYIIVPLVSGRRAFETETVGSGSRRLMVVIVGL